MPSSEIPDNVALLAGPQLFGHLFNYGLFGVLSTQVYMYYISDSKDSLRIKIFIYGLYVAELVQTILASHDAVEVLAIGWGDLVALNSPQWIWLEAPIFSGLISASVQSFYAWRISVLSKSTALQVFICLISLMQSSGAVAVGVIARITNDDTVLQLKTKKPLVVWLGGSVACDCIIAGCMLYYLWRGMQRSLSDKLITRLMRLTIETGSLTASVATLDLVLFLTFQHNNLHMAPSVDSAITLSKLYTNALMMVFNNRGHMSGLRGGVHHGSNRLWSTRDGTHIDTSRENVTKVKSAPREISLQTFNTGGNIHLNDSDGQSDISKLKSHAESV